MISIIKLFRIRSWWNYIIPPVLAAVYFVVLVKGYDFIQSLSLISLWFVSIVGTAAFGFTLNDIFDAKSDKKAGKINQLALLSKWKQILIVFLSMVMAITPLTILNLSLISIILICSQFMLLLLYSAPPIRLKGNVYWSTILDSLYSGFIFILAILFSENSTSFVFNNNLLLTLSISALFFLRGLRNILNHHIQDSQYDKLLNTGNFALKFGQKRTLSIIKTIVIIEVIAIVVILFQIPNPYFEYSIYFLIFSFFYFVFKIYDIKNKGKTTLDKIQFANDFYEDLLPLLFLIYLSIENILFLVLMLVHVIIFKNKLVVLILEKILYGFVFRKLILWLYFKAFCNKYAKSIYKLLGFQIND